MLACPVVWRSADTVTPFVWWDQYGGNDMPAVSVYMIYIQAATPNQTAEERYFKAYKNVNGKTRTRMGFLTADQFNSADDEHITVGIQHARVYSRLNNTAEWEDPTRAITVDEKK